MFEIKISAVEREAEVLTDQACVINRAAHEMLTIAGRIETGDTSLGYVSTRLREEADRLLDQASHMRSYAGTLYQCCSVIRRADDEAALCLDGTPRRYMVRAVGSDVLKPLAPFGPRHMNIRFGEL